MSESQPLQDGSKAETTDNAPTKSFWSFMRLPFGRKHKVDKFYRQQSDLLENYENDKCQIRVNFFIILFVCIDICSGRN